MTLKPGDRIGSYEIVSRLGAGGMGVVYRAHDSKLERDVAIKVLSAKGATDSDRLRRFEQEARAASALDHPNIITIHEIGETDDGQPFIVMQLVDGKSLRELIDARLGLNETLRIATQIADGLARAHRRGIIHRDLKPDNVMVTDDGLVKILDFGLAKLAEPTVDSGLATVEREKPQTQEGRIVGTAHYMSPEQAQGETVDSRSDIFSFGALLYEMVACKRPFRGSNTVAVLSEIVQKEPERLGTIDPSLPLDLDKIIHRALRKDPARRFQNTADMKVALDELSDELDSGDALTASAVRAAVRVPKRRWPLAATAALVVAAGIALALRSRVADVPSFNVTPLTSDAGFEREPALSPDGRQLAFVKDDHIYVKLIGESDAVPLTNGNVRDANPTWSPDGTRVAFLRHRSESGHDILEIPAVGGTPRLLGRANGRGHGLSYAPDGKRLTIVHQPSPDEREAIYLLSKETGETHRLTSPPPHRHGDDLSKFSPDGTSVAFARNHHGPNVARTGDVAIHNIDRGETRVLVEEPGMIYGLDFTPDGRHVVYSSGLSWDSLHLEVVSIDGGMPRPILSGTRSQSVSAARTANLLAVEKMLTDWNIWKVGGPASASQAPPELVIGSTWNDMSPDLSPDGTRIAFQSGRSGEWEVWTANADGTDEHRVTRIGGAGIPRWSPDGSRIAFNVVTEKIRDISVIDARGGFPQALTDDAFDNIGPTWSADGSTIFYESHRPDGVQIWKVPSDGSGSAELVLADARFAHQTEAGELLFVRHRTRWRLTPNGAVDTGHRTAHLPESVWRDTIVFFQQNRNVPQAPALELFDLTTRATSTLWEFDENGGGTTPSVSADGKWVHYGRRDSEGSDILLVENVLPSQ